MALPPSTLQRVEDSFDGRWARWKAAAAVQDEIWHRRAVFAFSAAAAVGTIALGFALALR